MKLTVNTYNPDYALHLGAYLEEVLEAREISKQDLAERMGIDEAYINQILNRKRFIEPDTDLKLERVLGVNSEIWINMSTNYQLFDSQSKGGNY